MSSRYVSLSNGSSRLPDLELMAAILQEHRPWAEGVAERVTYRHAVGEDPVYNEPSLMTGMEVPAWFLTRA